MSRSLRVTTHLAILSLLGLVFCQPNSSLLPLQFVGNSNLSGCDFSTAEWKGDRAPYSLTISLAGVSSFGYILNDIENTSIMLRPLFLGSWIVIQSILNQSPGNIKLQLASAKSTVTSNATDNFDVTANGQMCGSSGINEVSTFPGETGTLLTFGGANLNTTNTSFLTSEIIKQCQPLVIIPSGDMAIDVSTVVTAGVPTTTQRFNLDQGTLVLYLPFRTNEIFFFSATDGTTVATSRQFTIVGQESDDCVLLAPPSSSAPAPVSTPKPSQTGPLSQPKFSSAVRRAVIGGTIGGALVAATLVAIAFILLRRWRRKQNRGIQRLDLDNRNEGHIEPNMVLADRSYVVQPLILPGQSASEPNHPRRKGSPDIPLSESELVNIIATSQTQTPVKVGPNGFEQRDSTTNAAQAGVEQSSSNTALETSNSQNENAVGTQDSVRTSDPAHIWHEDGGTAHDVSPIEHPPPYQQRLTSFT